MQISSFATLQETWVRPGSVSIYTLMHNEAYVYGGQQNVS